MPKIFHENQVNDGQQARHGYWSFWTMGKVGKKARANGRSQGEAKANLSYALLADFLKRRGFLDAAQALTKQCKLVSCYNGSFRYFKLNLSSTGTHSDGVF